MNAARTVPTFPPTETASPPWLLIGVCAVLIVGGFVFFFLVRKESHPWYEKRISWMSYLFGDSDPDFTKSSELQDTVSPLTRLKTKTSDIPVKPSESWCFIGEDNTGRWCVQVPLPSLCEPIRSYGSRNSCEMTLAQQLPSGIVTRGGTSTTPLASLSLAR